MSVSLAPSLASEVPSRLTFSESLAGILAKLVDVQADITTRTASLGRADADVATKSVPHPHIIFPKPWTPQRRRSETSEPCHSRGVTTRLRAELVRGLGSDAAWSTACDVEHVWIAAVGHVAHRLAICLNLMVVLPTARV